VQYGYPTARLCWHENETAPLLRRINPLDHDAVTAAIAWDDHTLRLLQGKKLQVRFRLQDGELFSFWFE